METVMRSYPNDWVADSIMHRKGVGGGSSGVTHELTEETQGTYLYTIGPYADPVLSIEPGDRVIVETRDAFEGKITSESDVPSELLEVPFLNPQCGPIFVTGAEKGDVLAVHIESMAPRGPQPRGTCCMIKEFGGLTSTYYTATLNEPLPEKVRKVVVDEESVYWSDRVTLPYKPHIGTLSCSPQIDSINSLTPDDHGGNMDLPDMGPGTDHLSAGAGARRAALHRRCPCLPGGRRGLRSRGRVPHHHHDYRRPDQGLDNRLATPGGR